MKGLFDRELRVVNVGLESFHQSILDSGGISRHVRWAPPGEGDPSTANDVAALFNDESVHQANVTAYERYLSAQPILVGLEPAREAIPGIGSRTLMHAGPPIEFGRMCGPMKGAIVGAILFEGWAPDAATAEKLASSGGIEFSPCHRFGAVGPMAGVISPSMDVWIVENRDRGNRSYSNLNEGLGKVLRFGANSQEVIERLRWMNQTLAPALRDALSSTDGIELKPIMAQALHMGDEVHNRNAAASAILLKRLLPLLLRGGVSEDLSSIIDFINSNDHFFLNVSMAACKAMLDSASSVAGSSMVTAMSRNGVEFGIRVSGCGDRWFTAPAPVVDGLFFPGFSEDDGAPDLGDSAITETAGVGGFAMAAAPAIVQFVGGSPRAAIGYTREMSTITIGRNNAFTLPQIDFAGTPAGIDIVKVVDSGVCPIINTGIAHREAGIGQVGAGITRAPMACFSAALRDLVLDMRSNGSSGGE